MDADQEMTLTLWSEEAEGARVFMKINLQSIFKKNPLVDYGLEDPAKQKEIAEIDQSGNEIMPMSAGTSTVALYVNPNFVKYSSAKSVFEFTSKAAVTRCNA